ncbi:MAG: alkaline phosphatase family protein [Anaerolineae bacterium]|nr:alkaline phosphatase family protein [Anaerolineae bacterium]
MPDSQRVILFLVDGMRPDGLLAAHTPALDRLRVAGAHTLTARTVMPSMTLPCHASLILGVPPARHGITTNVWAPQVRPVPGLFDVLAGAGLATAFFYNWEELRDLARPGALHAAFMVKDTSGDSSADTEIARLAASWLRDRPFDFAFVYLGATDIAGHAWGWMSERYLAAISHADRCIATVLAAVPHDVTVLVTSDHGGHAQTHGTELPEDMTIPLIASGPGIPPGITLNYPVQITDIAPTITRLLGVPAPGEWIGRPLAFERPDLAPTPF